ncbi:hypothetical protein GCM10022248_25680 [Nonomuraea soli]
MAAGPAAAAENDCKKKGGVLRSTSSMVSVCDNVAGLAAAGGYGWRMNVPDDNAVMGTAEELAMRAGLPGLSRASAVLSLADLAGVAAGAGVPAVPARVPAGLESVSQVAELPDLPGLPSEPVSALPQPLDKRPALPALPDASGATSLKPPMELIEPVTGVKRQVEGTVTGTVPQVPDVAGHVPLTEPKAVEDLTGLLDGLDLGK